MSLFTPGRRWQPPFFPFKKEPFGLRVLRKTERWIKGPLFGCRMCGNCLLQETAFICPMECPKGMRNGPCGGSTAEKCYVDNTRPCIWYQIYKRAHKMGREETLIEVLPPLDWDSVGTETWGDVTRSIKRYGTGRFIKSRFSKDKYERELAWQSVFRPVRQPEWWEGDSLYHPPGYKEPVSYLESMLKKGEFVITTEVQPPLGSVTNKLKENIGLVKNFVSAINFTDSASASPRMSSLACSKFAVDLGADSVMQIAARDKTRSGLQSDVVGANALGINNILCVTGDNARIGPSPTSNTNILDMDAIQMLWILRRMRDEGIYLDGRKIKNPPKIFLGAAASPFASEPKYQALREKKKVNAGAQFFQTNLIFDTARLDRWLEELYKVDIIDKVYILAGVTPIRSLKMAEHLHFNVPGVKLPDSVLDKFRDCKADDYQKLGFEIAMDIISVLKEKEGLNGLHIMSVGWEEIVPRIVEQLK